MNSFPTRVLSAAALLDYTEQARWRPGWQKVLAPCPIEPDTHSAASAGHIGLETSWTPQTCLAPILVLCGGATC